MVPVAYNEQLLRCVYFAAEDLVFAAGDTVVRLARKEARSQAQRPNYSYAGKASQDSRDRQRDNRTDTVLMMSSETLVEHTIVIPNDYALAVARLQQKLCYLKSTLLAAAASPPLVKGWLALAEDICRDGEQILNLDPPAYDMSHPAVILHEAVQGVKKNYQGAHGKLHFKEEKTQVLKKAATIGAVIGGGWLLLRWLKH